MSLKMDHNLNKTHFSQTSLIGDESLYNISATNLLSIGQFLFIKDLDERYRQLLK